MGAVVLPSRADAAPVAPDGRQAAPSAAGRSAGVAPTLDWRAFWARPFGVVRRMELDAEVLGADLPGFGSASVGDASRRPKACCSQASASAASKSRIRGRGRAELVAEARRWWPSVRVIEAASWQLVPPKFRITSSLRGAVLLRPLPVHSPGFATQPVCTVPVSGAAQPCLRMGPRSVGLYIDRLYSVSSVVVCVCVCMRMRAMVQPLPGATVGWLPRSSVAEVPRSFFDDGPHCAVSRSASAGCSRLGGGAFSLRCRASCGLLGHSP